MTERYAEESSILSDQDDVIGVSSSDMEEEDADDEDEQENGTDTEGMHIPFSPQLMDSVSIRTEMEETNPTTEFNGLKSILKLFGYGSGLLLSTFALIILLPLYYEQLALNGEQFNIFGAILFVSFIVTMILVGISVILGSINKWKVPFYRPPVPWKRLLPIVTSFGVSIVLFTVSCYQRVPCHLQDPLKGGALVFSLIFYFFFCRKVMGLQRIFSATTAVVGLFISVDYGLCDEFRCRGSDLTVTPNDDATASVGWQGRAVWTLFYVIAIFVWAFHVVLLEGFVVSVPKNGKSPVTSATPNHLLRTVSRIVANSEPLLTPTPIKKPPSRQRVHPLHLIVWIHALSFVFIVAFGWIDIFPAAGRIKSFSSHMSDTENSLLCHLNIYNRVPDVRSNQEDVDLLSNLVPDSPQYNRTVQRLRKPRSLDATEGDTTNHTKLNEAREKLHEIDPGDFHRIFHVATPKHTIAGLNHTAHKINTERHWHKSKPIPQKKKHHDRLKNNNSNNRATNIVLERKISGDCGHCQMYALLLVGVYLIFAVCIVNFLIVAESAVFTVTVITATLPLVGIFWSIFKISKTTTIATLIWSPEISGEFICSLLGTPIVFLGLGLLCRAYVSENSATSRCETPSVSSSLRNRYTSFS